MHRESAPMEQEHLDEGTAHAWLDGALTPDEAAGVEAHVASCADCAALVAEARGLVAGASRILGALDEVPGDVIPTAPVADPAVVPLVRPRAAAPRWRVSPGLRAAAAAIFVVGAGTLVLRTTAMRDRVSAARSVAVPMSAAAADTAAAPLVAAPGAAVTPLAAPRQEVVMADRRAAAAAAPARAGAPSADLAAAPPPAPRPLSPFASTSGVVASSNAAGAARADTAEREAARTIGAASAPRFAAKIAAAPALTPPVPQAGAAPGVGPAAAQARALRRAAEPESVSGLAEATVTAADAVRRAPDRVAALAGCYRLVEPAPGFPERIELQAAALPPGERRRGFALRLSAGAGTAAYWTPLAGDSVRVVWTVPSGGVDLRLAHTDDGALHGVANPFMGAGVPADAAPAGGTPRPIVARRVACAPGPTR